MVPAEERDLPLDAEPSKPSLLRKAPVLLALANTVVILSVAGLLFYTRFVFKRPPITENGERQKLAKIHEKPALPTTPGLIQIEPFTINIQPSPPQPKSADGTQQQLQGKLHYATIGFALELRDLPSQEIVEKVRPALMDRILSTIGRKAFSELTTVQGRYILKNQLLEIANRLALGSQSQAPLIVTHLYFTHFIVQ